MALCRVDLSTVKIKYAHKSMKYIQKNTKQETPSNIIFPLQQTRRVDSSTVKIKTEHIKNITICHIFNILLKYRI